MHEFQSLESTNRQISSRSGPLTKPRTYLTNLHRWASRRASWGLAAANPRYAPTFGTVPSIRVVLAKTEAKFDASTLFVCKKGKTEPFNVEIPTFGKDPKMGCLQDLPGDRCRSGTEQERAPKQALRCDASLDRLLDQEK